MPTSFSTTVVRRLAWATLVANALIILTGGLVRLTGSGLGCPTWPRCTDDSFVPHRELGIHGVIEFGNRMLTYVLIAVVVAAVVVVWRWAGTSRTLRRHAVLIAVGVPFQGVIGGITVLTNLNPWVVSLHLLLSMALVSASAALVLRVDPPAGLTVPPVLVRRLATACYLTTWFVVYLGTVVTGSGPHAGDVDAPRNGLSPELMSKIHAGSVYVLVGLTIALVLTSRTVGRHRPALALLGVELAQGVVGYVQYFTGLPVAVVALHLLGAATLVAVATWVLRDAAGSAAADSERTVRRNEPAPA